MDPVAENRALAAQILERHSDEYVADGTLYDMKLERFCAVGLLAHEMLGLAHTELARLDTDDPTLDKLSEKLGLPQNREGFYEIDLISAVNDKLCKPGHPATFGDILKALRELNLLP